MGRPSIHLPLALPPVLRCLAFGPVPRPDRRRYFTRDAWWLHLYAYHASLIVDGVELPITPGTASLIPPGSTVEYRWPQADNLHLFAHLLLRGTSAQTRELSLLFPLGTRFDAVWAAMREAIAMHPLEPVAAQARIWDLLWRLAGSAPALSGAPDPLVAAAVARVTALSGTPPRATAVAQALAVSVDTLDRRFQAVFGLTLAAWMRQRTAERIRHLLGPAGLSPAEAARELGAGDLQAFNKLVRRLLGTSPRRVRS